MAPGQRVPEDQIARRVNAAAKLVASGLDHAAASRRLARRFKVSERQARRYVDQATEGAVPVPEPKVVFTVKAPVGLVRRVRSHARRTRRTISAVVSQALQEFLDRVGTGPGGAR